MPATPCGSIRASRPSSTWRLRRPEGSDPHTILIRSRRALPRTLTRFPSMIRASVIGRNDPSRSAAQDRTQNAGHRLPRRRARLFRPSSRIRAAVRTPLSAPPGASPAMTLDLTFGALVTLGLLGYLTYALVRPERF
ncbi:K(+)-transporting ATPase subunit F [Methylobacterium sp. V23]|nr:K(+)-transporting ATPase subunit F [Methylobacterium sp. V23]